MQIILGKVDALQLAAGDGQITRYGTAGTKGDRIELFQQCFRRNFVADLTVQFKGDPGLFQKLDASFYQMLVQLHIGYTIHQKPAGAVGTFINGNAVACLVKLVSTGQAGRAAADNGNFLSAAVSRLVGFDIAFCKCCFNDILFKIADTDCTACQAGTAGSFTGSRTDVRGEFREIISFIQARIGEMIQPLINKVVKFRHQIMQRTA